LLKLRRRLSLGNPPRIALQCLDGRIAAESPKSVKQNLQVISDLGKSDPLKNYKIDPKIDFIFDFGTNLHSPTTALP